jgi:hypothetical protein
MFILLMPTSSRDEHEETDFHYSRRRYAQGNPSGISSAIVVG